MPRRAVCSRLEAGFARLDVSSHEIGYMARSSNDSWGQFAGRIMLGRGACGVTEYGRAVTPAEDRAVGIARGWAPSPGR